MVAFNKKKKLITSKNIYKLKQGKNSLKYS